MKEKLYEETLNFFREISKVPRPSGKEEKMIAYLTDFAEKRHLAYKKDAARNVLIQKPASPGYENHKTVALQAHIDMVCEKNADVQHDFLNDPIRIVEDGDWWRADGTTLGGDDGIGVAAMLAVLADDTLKHGPLECLFTVEEETGLSGALGVASDMLSAEVLLNLDSEDEHEFIIGCAGGIDTLAHFALQQEPVKLGYYYFTVKVGGLQGGHSGENINDRRANANKVLAQYLWQLSKDTEVRLCAISGGNLRNAIAREASATVAVPFAEKEHVRVALNHFIAQFEEDWLAYDPNFFMELESETEQRQWFLKSLSENLLNALYACPHGVLAMSAEISGLVETSTNLASVKMIGDEIVVSTSQRSSIESQKKNACQMVESVFLLAGAKVTHSDGYPGWKPNMKSALLSLMEKAYEDLLGEKPKVKVIHAGLECGLFLTKFPSLDMVSFGPTILDIHSPAERMNIPSVKKFASLLGEVLEKL
ncbi:MAG: aminoacyl-histidine dipeptidase [Bacteroidales bacterium]|nr:aminoacyl-histidine dipeptidase [Bacteroidales bacterium]